MNNVVYVGGNGRSGTSLVSRIMFELGFETLDSSHSVKHESSPLFYKDDGTTLDYAKTIETIRDMNSRHVNWFWKSPKDLGCSDSWIYLFNNVKFVFVLRSPFDIAVSSGLKEFIPEECYYYDIAHNFQTLSEFIVNKRCPTFVIGYESLLSNKHETVAKLSGFLGVDNQIDVERIVGDCFTNGYSDRNGLKQTIGLYDLDLDHRNAFKLTYLPNINRKLASINDLLNDVESVTACNSLSNNDCLLTTELSSFDIDLKGMCFKEALVFYRSLYSEHLLKLKDCNEYSTPVKLEYFFQSTNQLLVATYRLRAALQAKYMAVESLWA